ncbi:motility associated factor glycosyltransferase family protein [Lysinibacillus parviboronicapiens]|uniref:motility associated factor glycosyltransferase family protein n=1 Tax=Lysinibacillus parviboronicapiens TaxID=436516 RepID=UPI000D3D0A0E|nr:6-hydroxymethylpterin diphosphokinase MptE-like protein [Lysinibacillus parviboronicapiens]
MSKIRVEVLESKIGVPALQVEINDKKMMLHSKYNPVQEAERFINSLREKIEEADHILFYGIGLGYHVKYFSTAYPEKLISAYEPIEEIATNSLKERAITEFPKDKLSHYIVEDSQHPLVQNMELLGELIHQKMLLIVLPVYERLFSKQTKEFGETLKSFLMTKGSNILAATLFSKRWTINALMNLPGTFKHENIILHKKKFFKNKPVILVSAGPSLDEDLENLRIIKEQGLAYIFAVGSAAKVLILNNIFPDAMCTYDPQPHNHTVFKEIYEQGITDIPMIYGTTVGFETLQFYQGPKLYFVTSQDHITPQFHKEQIPVISDAPTIALIMLQIFHALEVKQVYLVGQNLAFKKNKYYSEEIKRYDYEKKELTNSLIQKLDLINSFEVKDVHGGKVMTNDSLNRMRLDIEKYIDFVNMSVINTTNGGAAIKGANFKPLQQIIEELSGKVVVDEWWKSIPLDGFNELNQAFKKKYRKEFELFIQLDKELENYLNDFNESLISIKENQIKQKLEELERLFEKYQRNIFFLTTISLIAKLAFEKLNAEKQIISKMDSSIKKVESTIQMYNGYLNNCRAFYRDLAPIITNLTLLELEKQLETKGYNSTSGVFHYVGGWKKKYHTLNENDVSNYSIYTSGVETKEKGAQINFRFYGETLKVFGTVHSKNALKLQVMIDDKVDTIILTDGVNEDKYGSFMRQKLFETSGLDGKMHDVEICILSDNPSIVFEGIEICSTGRAYHIDEVISVGELEIGKRIRCHYKAIYNQVGEFSGLGDEISNHLPVISTAYPNGDFYFIMVDEIDREKKLIADRVLQNYVSWNELTVHLKNSINLMEIALPTGNSTYSNETDIDKLQDLDSKFISQNKNNIMWNYDSNSSTWINENMWCDVKEKLNYVGFRGSNIGTKDKDFNTLYIRRENTIGAHVGFRPLLIL